MPFGGALTVGLIGGGASLLGGLFGSKKSAAQKQEDKNMVTASSDILGAVPGQLKSGQANTDKGIGVADTGSKTIGQGVGDISHAGDIFKTILGGSREDTQRLLGPQVQTILSQYDNAAKAATELGPRGGGRTGILAEEGTGKASAYGKLLQGAIPGAASGLSTVGGQEVAAGGAQANVGLGEAGIGQEQQKTAMSSLSSILGSQSQTAARNAAAANNLGSGIGSILMNSLKGVKFGGGGSSSSGGNVYGVDAGGG